jgi:vancomycin resistance protein YoaR
MKILQKLGVKKTPVKKEETKEEQVVFKNNSNNKNKKVESPKTEKPKSDVKKDEKIKTVSAKVDNNSKPKVVEEKPKPQEEKSEEKQKANNINTAEFFEEKNNKKRKLIYVLINIVVILIVLLVFSTMFAIVHAMNPTIANGVSINNIDISNLTYDEAKEKLEEAFNISLDVNIELKHNDYSYIIKSSAIDLSYNLNEALNSAYSIGRGSNIIECNYSLIATAILKKNFEVQFTYDEEEIDRIITEISTAVPDLIQQYSYYIEDDNLIIKSGTDGITVKTEDLKNMILNDIKNRNPMELAKNFENSQIEIPYEDVKADEIDIEKVYSEVYSEPQDAYYVEATETTAFEIHPDVDGIDFAISIEEAKAMISEEKEEYTIPLTRKEAEIKIDDIGIEAFPYKISTFSTTYDASNTSRSENLRIAASKINGTVIMPGEQFSFNGVVGERTVEEGYQNAKIYSDGQVVDGLAGGICQISSTLYNAALLANLQINERYNHTFKTSYVPAGRDATVVYGVKDLKFTNDRTYPIKIEASVANGVAIFTIYGIEEENEYDVSIYPEATSVTPYTTQTIVDSSLAAGTTVIKQVGMSGGKYTTYKEVSLNGVVISRELLSNDTYLPMTRIILTGPTTTE